MRMKKLIFSLMLVGLLTLLGGTALAADPEIEDIHTYADTALEHTRIGVQTVEDVQYLFLPAGMPQDAVPVYFTVDKSAVVVATGAKHSSVVKNGDVLNLPALCGDGPQYSVTFRMRAAAGSASQSIVFVTEEKLPALFLASDDPVNKGREWVESSPDKSNKATGAMVLWDETGGTVYSGALKQIKGRGNSTWGAAKKPYQIKLAEAADLLQTGQADNRAKTWVLLANYFDASMVKNAMTYDLASAMQMDAAMEQQFVNLYYDGEYRGVYELCEKVEVGSGRVDIKDLEKENEEANPSVADLAELPVAKDQTASGATYVYCTGMQSPQDITGGYLLEMDMPDRAQVEKCYFVTKRGTYIVVKSPECCSKDEMAYIAEYYQQMEDALYNGGRNDAAGKTFGDYVDVESAAQCYLINEFSKNLDAFVSSSYLYKDAGEDQMKMGPVWDYDFAYGAGSDASVRSAEGMYTLYSQLGRALYALPEFRTAVHDTFYTVMWPLLDGVLDSSADTASRDGALHSLAYYEELLQGAAGNNSILWDTVVSSGDVVLSQGEGWRPNFDNVRSYMLARTAYLNEAFKTWNADDVAPLDNYLDVSKDDWYYDAVSAITQLGLMRGVGNSLFQPEQKMTRAQAAQILYNLEGAEAPQYWAAFPDVKQTDWFAAPVLWAQETKVVLGYPDGTFRPGQSVTREDLLVLMYRYCDEPAVTGSLLAGKKDGAAVSGYAVSAVEWALENKIIEGYTDGTINPKGTASRAELATVLLRFYDKFVA